jgi:ferredoxin
MHTDRRNRVIVGALVVMALIAVSLLGVDSTRSAPADIAAGTSADACATDCGTCPSTQVAQLQSDTAGTDHQPASEESACSGNCDLCSPADTAPCPPAATDERPASDTAQVDPKACVSCVRCANVAPEAFRMTPETRKAEVIDGAPAEAIERGAMACPVDAVVP